MEQRLPRRRCGIRIEASWVPMEVRGRNACNSCAPLPPRLFHALLLHTLVERTDEERGERGGE